MMLKTFAQFCASIQIISVPEFSILIRTLYIFPYVHTFFKTYKRPAEIRHPLFGRPLKQTILGQPKGIQGSSQPTIIQ